MTIQSTSHKRALLIALAGAAALAALLPARARVQDGWRLADLPPQTEPAGFAHPKLDGGLNKIYGLYLGGGLAAARTYLARQTMIDADGDLVRVVVHARREAAVSASALVTRLKADLMRIGGRVETSHRELVQCLIPVAALAAAAEIPALARLRLPFKPRPLVEMSEGVRVSGADAWQKLSPYRVPEAVKVGILDLGFKGYESLKSAGELPSNVTARSFRADGLIEGPSSWDDVTRVHGAACAEVVHDMAPDAKLYLVNFNTDVEHHNAVDWLVDEAQVDVISYSVGWTNAGDGRGTGPINDDVKYAAQKGVAWAGSSGNYALDHWEGTFQDTDGDGWHNFTPADEILNWSVSAYDTVSAWLSWDDFGSWDGYDYSGSNQDYDLYLYMWTGSSWRYVDKSTYAQTGLRGEWPTEDLGSWYGYSTTNWGVAIKKKSATRDCTFDLFTTGNAGAIEYNVPAGSLCSPADAAECVTVGATDWEDDAYHTYSSRGPTNDGRIKPDFAAPSRVSTKSYNDLGYWFSGTSAAAPHLAGAFALLKGMLPYSLPQVGTLLQVRAVDLGPAGTDNQFGVGRISLKKK
jgi:hypothetical protein